MINKQTTSIEKPDENAHQLDAPLPENFPVSVLLECRPAISEWIDVVWSAIAVTIGSRSDQIDEKPCLIRTGSEIKNYLCTGLQVKLYKDECESYYHNLMSPTPRCYVVAHTEDVEDPPEPFIITMSFDEAHAYLEGEDEIYDVDVPPELYKWTEAFILVHYVAEKRKKRKRKDWKQPEQEKPL
ncbi:MAG: DUF3305 domain-containing protein [Gammaproteobacteria bacterium]|nr:DUF3305 domain-containing protein [Gammaproteobacteria bacterium]